MSQSFVFAILLCQVIPKRNERDYRDYVYIEPQSIIVTQVLFFSLSPFCVQRCESPSMNPNSEVIRNKRLNLILLCTRWASKYVHIFSGITCPNSLVPVTLSYDEVNTRES